MAPRICRGRKTTQGFVGRTSRCRNWLDSGGPGQTRSFGFSAGGRRPALGSALVSGSAADRQPVLPGEPGQRTRLNDKTFLGRAFRRGSACVRGGVPGGASSRRGRLSFGDEATRLPEGTLDGFSGGGVSSGNTLTAGRGPRAGGLRRRQTGEVRAHGPEAGPRHSRRDMSPRGALCTPQTRTLQTRIPCAHTAAPQAHQAGPRLCHQPPSTWRSR